MYTILRESLENQHPCYRMAIPPGVEPGPSARQADIIAVRPWDQKFRFVCLAAQSPIALAEFRLGVHPLRTRIRLLGSCQNGTGLWIGCVGRTRTSDLQLMRLARWPLLYLAISVCHYSFVLASSQFLNHYIAVNPLNQVIDELLIGHIPQC